MKASIEALRNGPSDGAPKGKKGSAEKDRRRMVSLFTIASAIVTISIGYVVGTQIANSVRAQMMESYAIATATQVRGTVNSYINEADLATPFTGDKYTNFQEYINRSIEGTNVVKVKLWRLDSTVLYSNDPEIVGKKFATKEPLQIALKGDPYYEVTNLQADENYREASQYNRLLEIYVPVYLDDANPTKVSGVYEVYMSVLPLDKYAGDVMRSLYYGLGVLILLLIIIAEVASWMLRKRNDKLRELSTQLEMRADTDGLTGLYNHRHFQGHLERELARALRYNEPISLLLIDLDFFKSVNDRYGHQTGDEVLRQVSSIFGQVLRNVDYAARYGGEEFIAILPGTDAAGALTTAERLRKAAEDLKIDSGDGKTNVKVTLSCGVADYPSCATERESLIAAADSALLFAKRKGRNRVVFFRDIAGSEIQEGDLEKLVSRLQNASMPTIQALMAAVDSRDSYDRSHSRNVASLATGFAQSMDLEENMAHALALAAQVHDVGKVNVPRSVLQKNEPLTTAEIEAIRKHPEASAKIVESAAQMEQLLSAVLHHHENWDGTGYPNGLSGESIPPLARMLRIIDAFEAMVSDRPYRPALAIEAAVEELKKNSGTQFDPNMLEKFVHSVKTQKIVPLPPGPSELDGDDASELAEETETTST